MNVQTIYAQQMSIIRGLRDRHLATVDDALSVWRPRADLPPIAWHAAHASLFTAITLCGMGACQGRICGTALTNRKTRTTRNVRNAEIAGLTAM